MSRHNTASIPARRDKCGTPEYHPSYQTSVWELHHGLIHLYIIGDNADAWLACSAPDYSPGPSGTFEEQRIARRAVDILNDFHRNPDAEIPEIRAALKKAALEFLSHN